MTILNHQGLFVLLLGLSGCGTSALIRDDDASFAHAQARLARTNDAVEALNVPMNERVAFLQAESMYRYRYNESGRAAGSFMAQGVVVITNVPALQAFGGSITFADLRLRSADMAVQLWETFLLHYPRSVLRPLALYRLGWAYRSANVYGLPRDSGDDAFRELAEEETSQAAPTESVPGMHTALAAVRGGAVHWKSKATAGRWSIIPGLGQIYVGKTASGIVRLTIAAAAIAAIITPIVISAQRPDDLTWKRDWPLLASGIVGFVTISIDYTASFEDAMRNVVKWNERAEAKFEETYSQAP